MAHPAAGLNSISSFVESIRAQLKEISDCEITPLESPLEVKYHWLHAEWDSKNDRLAKKIKDAFPSREDLVFETAKKNADKVNEVFMKIRGNYSLWGSRGETADWVKITIPALPYRWICDKVEVLFGKTTRFDIKKLDPIVLWQNPNEERLQLIEGNTRISSWHRLLEKPASLPAVIFVGRTSDRIDPKLVVEIDWKSVYA